MSSEWHDDRERDDREEDKEVTTDASFSGASTHKLWTSIPHYYGDSVRQLLLGAAALMLIFSPLYSDVLRVQFPFIIIGALLAAAFAALMNPRDKWVILGSAVVSGTGLVIYAMWGMYGYKSIDPVAFMLRVVVALIFLFAFYFSMKTLRAFMLHQIGKRETMDEFEDDEVKAGSELLERDERHHPDHPLRGQ
ncbi:MAG: hypothetical protein Q7R90_00530 [bacterium]|nr:hypothetical protein [bacterium]